MTEEITHILSTDVLVVGGGIAGLTAAIRAKELGVDVILACKAMAGRSGASVFIGGDYNHYPLETDLDEAVKTGIRRSEYIDDQELVDMIVRRARGIISKSIERWGVKYLKRGGDFRGSFSHGVPGICFKGGGPGLMGTVRTEAERVGVKIIDRVMVCELLTSAGKHSTKGNIVGTVGFDIRSGEFHVFKAKAVVLATGNWTIQVPYSEYDGSITGDGQGMAFRAGAEMRKMEQIAFQVKPAHGSVCDAEIGKFDRGLQQTVDKDGREIRYLADKDKKYVRGKSVLPAMKAIKEGRGVYTSYRRGTAEDFLDLMDIAPYATRALVAAGYEIPKDLVLNQISFYGSGQGGGLKVNKNMETSIPGLFAAGSVTERMYSSVQGITGALITGWIAADGAARYAEKVSTPEVQGDQIDRLKSLIYGPLRVKDGVTYLQLRRKIRRIFEQGLGPGTRNKENLDKAVGEIEGIKKENLPRLMARDTHELMMANGNRNILEYMYLVAKAALMRTESRGAHLRTDYPERDDENWMKWIVAKMEDGEIRFWTEDIPMPILKPGE